MKKSIIVVMALILGFNSFGQTSSNKELEENINEVFESYAFYNRFIGSVLISKEDNIIYEKSFGHADAENLKNNTKNSIFSIASVTKSLTIISASIEAVLYSLSQLLEKRETEDIKNKIVCRKTLFIFRILEKFPF